MFLQGFDDFSFSAFALPHTSIDTLLSHLDFDIFFTIRQEMDK